MLRRMREYWEEELGHPVKVFPATDYTRVIEAMKRVGRRPSRRHRDT